MLRIVKFLGASALAALVVWALNHSFAVGGKALPAFGKLLNPFTGIWQNTPLPIPKPFAPVSSEHLKGKVSVSYDARMVPHVFADSLIDVFFVQGYLHAQNRLFQMDFSTRATAGRLSEIVGSKALNFDKEQRRLGMVWAAENAVATWKKNPETKKILDAYTLGVNAYISSLKPKDFPIEYKLMGFEPEPWSMMKTALFYKGMAKSLCFEEFDLELTKIREVLGPQAMDALFPEYFEEQTPIVPRGTSYGFTPAKGNPQASNLPAPNLSLHGTPEEKSIPGIGSNNWAVSGAKTMSKHPILCSDPHLERKLPAVWYEIQLHTPQFNAYGASFPGIPGIMIGFNEHIAWAETNMGHDVKDWYKITWTDKAQTTYQFDGANKKADLVVEKIKVLGALEPVLDTVRYTVWGPVPYRDSSAYKDLALRWLGHDPGDGNELMTFVNIMQAKNYTQFKNALKHYHSPGQNFCFASRDGDIAIEVTGEIPIRAKGQGRYIQDGSSSANGWGGIVPREHMPGIVNPQRGYVFSANQHSTGPEYPYYYTSVNFDASRSRMLSKLLSGMDSITVDDMKALQNNSISLQGADALPAMLKLLDSTALDPAAKKLRADLLAWNGSFDAKLTAPILYELWFKAVGAGTWDEILKNKDANIMRLPNNERLVHLLIKDPNSIWFDDKGTEAKETAKEIVTAAFKSMATDYAKELVTNPLLNWGVYNNVGARHLARLDGFSRLNLTTNGTREALNANRDTHGPSWRMVVELGDSTKAWVVYPGGQSGDPGSADYDKFLNTWAEGKYYEALFLRSVPTANKDILFTQTFSPAAKK